MLSYDNQSYFTVINFDFDNLDPQAYMYHKSVYKDITTGLPNGPVVDCKTDGNHFTCTCSQPVHSFSCTPQSCGFEKLVCYLSVI